MTDPYSSLTNLGPELNIHNICGKFLMNSTLDLHYLAAKIWNSSYNPRRMPALILRKTRPRATVLIFRTGSALVIGAETMERLEEVSMKVAREVGAVLNLKKLRAESIVVTNIVGMGQLGTSSPTQISRSTSAGSARIAAPSSLTTCPPSSSASRSRSRR